MNKLYRFILTFLILFGSAYSISSVFGMDRNSEKHRQVLTSRQHQEEQDRLFALSLQEEMGGLSFHKSLKEQEEEQGVRTFLRDKDTMLVCYSDSPLMQFLYTIENSGWAQRTFDGLVENFRSKGVSFSNSRTISRNFLPSLDPQNYYAGLLWTALYGIEHGIKETDMHRMIEEIVRISQTAQSSSMGAWRAAIPSTKSYGTPEDPDYLLAQKMQQEEDDRAGGRTAKSTSHVRQEDTTDYVLAHRLQEEYERERAGAAHHPYVQPQQEECAQEDPRDRFVLQPSKYWGLLHTSPGIRRVAQYDMEYPSVAVFHPYSIFTGENTRGSGNLVCRYAYQFHQPQVIGHLPDPIRVYLTDIPAENISITFMTQNVPWDITHAYGFLLRLNYLLFSDAPYKQEGYWVQETPEVGVFNVLPAGPITVDHKKDILFPADVISHAEEDEEKQVVSSPSNLSIQGVIIGQTVPLYSVVKTKGRAHVCFHWLLSDEDEGIISRIANRGHAQTLQFFMDQTQRAVRNGRESLREPLTELQRLLRTA